jgi:hypothetical protein
VCQIDCLGPCKRGYRANISESLYLRSSGPGSSGVTVQITEAFRPLIPGPSPFARSSREKGVQESYAKRSRRRLTRFVNSYSPGLAGGDCGNGGDRVVVGTFARLEQFVGFARTKGG